MRRLMLSLALALAACGGGGSGGGGVQPVAFGNFPAASVVIGQGDFVSRLSNRGGSAGATTLDSPQHRVAFAGGTLYVADSANHRVLGFSGIPTTNGAAADFVLGQLDFDFVGPGTSSSTFNSPLECWSDGTRLFVVDAGNNRVLIWNSLPTANVPADVVVGQANPTSAVIGGGPSGLFHPQSVATAGGRLLVADSENNRVLIWNAVPTSDGAAADLVLGQPNLTSVALASTGPSTLLGPENVWSDGERVVVADKGNDRVLVWTSFPTSNGQAADLVLGQPNLLSNGSTLGPGGMGRPAAVFVNGNQLFVADTGLARVLVWDAFPTTNGQSPDQVIGQSDFFRGTANDTDQDNSENTFPSAQTLRFPGGVILAGDRLLVTDSDNHRVLVFQGH